MQNGKSFQHRSKYTQSRNSNMVLPCYMLWRIYLSGLFLWCVFLFLLHTHILLWIKWKWIPPYVCAEKKLCKWEYCNTFCASQDTNYFYYYYYYWLTGKIFEAKLFNYKILFHFEALKVVGLNPWYHFNPDERRYRIFNCWMHLLNTKTQPLAI